MENDNIQNENIGEDAEEKVGYVPEDKKPSVVKKLFKAAAICIILGVYGVLFVRFFVSCDSDMVDDILKTEKIVAAYESSPEDFEVQQYGITHWYESKNASGDESNLGGKLLSVSHLYYIPAAESLQVTVKFNLDILENSEASYSKELLPFRVYLEDEYGNVYESVMAEYDERYSFGYIRVCFEGVKLEKDDEFDEDGSKKRNTFELCLDMYGKDGKYGDEQYDSFSVYTGDKNYKSIEYK